MERTISVEERIKRAEERYYNSENKFQEKSNTIQNEKMSNKNNKLIKKLFTLNIPLYWFRSYYEFETFFLVFNPKQDINFILIG